MGYPSLPVKANYYHFPSEEGPCGCPPTGPTAASGSSQKHF